MKKLVCLLLVLAMGLSFCACGKSEGVKNTEALIAEISEDPLQNREAVEAAVAAWELLTEKEQGKVDNAEILLDAQSKLEQERQETFRWLEGDWINLYTLLNGYVYNEAEAVLNKEVVLSVQMDGAVFNQREVEWKCVDGGIRLGGMTNVVKPVQNGDITVLVTEGAETMSYIKLEDADKLFVHVELTSENIFDYLEIINVPCKVIDNFGEVLGEGENYWFASKVYDDGLIYFDSHELHIEYFRQTRPGRDPSRSETTQLYGGPNGYSSTNGQINWITADMLSIGRVTGTVCFVRAEYAEMVLQNEMRSVEVFGISKGSRSFYSMTVPNNLEACYY